MFVRRTKTEKIGVFHQSIFRLYRLVGKVKMVLFYDMQSEINLTNTLDNGWFTLNCTHGSGHIFCVV